MDAPNPSAIPTFANRTPLHCGAVGLIVRDLNRLAAYYRALLGLTVMEKSDARARLGIDGTVLLELERAPHALPDDVSTAGLYHTAFLMPTRTDLARWIVHIARHHVPISGASDHDVSEAIYLDDPEGNGIEVYSDRPPERWRRDGKLIFQKTDPLDIEDILREIDPASADYPAAPPGLRIGHVHLRVGDVVAAERFYVNALGLEVTRRRTGATFMSTGGYHHHIACNVWHSEGAGNRDPRRAGLAWIGLEAADGAAFDAARTRLQAAGAPLTQDADGFETHDPWGTRIRITKAA
jgi:catechol 2,3-dioxygenase